MTQWVDSAYQPDTDETGAAEDHAALDWNDIYTDPGELQRTAGMPLSQPEQNIRQTTAEGVTEFGVQGQAPWVNVRDQSVRWRAQSVLLTTTQPQLLVGADPNRKRVVVTEIGFSGLAICSAEPTAPGLTGSTPNPGNYVNLFGTAIELTHTDDVWVNLLANATPGSPVPISMYVEYYG